MHGVVHAEGAPTHFGTVDIEQLFQLALFGLSGAILPTTHDRLLGAASISDRLLRLAISQCHIDEMLGIYRNFFLFVPLRLSWKATVGAHRGLVIDYFAAIERPKLAAHRLMRLAYLLRPSTAAIDGTRTQICPTDGQARMSECHPGVIGRHASAINVR